MARGQGRGARGRSQVAPTVGKAALPGQRAEQAEASEVTAGSAEAVLEVEGPGRGSEGGRWNSCSFSTPAQLGGVCLTFQGSQLHTPRPFLPLLHGTYSSAEI